jgi:hypothetical protein
MDRGEKNGGGRMLIGRDELIQTIRHEFGHLVVAKALKFATGGVTLDRNHASAEIFLRPMFAGLSDVAEYAKRRIQVLYAGAGAQALRNGAIDSEWAGRLLDTTSANDFAKIRELLRIASAVQHPNDVDDTKRGELTTSVDNMLRSETGALVETHSALIAELTAHFISRLEAKFKETGKIPQPFILPATEINQFPGIVAVFGKL